jgi:hypothetical protein
LNIKDNENGENIFENRVLIASIIDDIVKLEERINFIQMDQVLLRRYIGILRKEFAGAIPRN